MSIFISYRRAISQHLVLNLKSAYDEKYSHTGNEMFVDQHYISTGDQFDNIIKPYLKKCTIFVLIIQGNFIDEIVRRSNNTINDYFLNEIKEINLRRKEYLKSIGKVSADEISEVSEEDYPVTIYPIYVETGFSQDELKDKVKDINVEADRLPIKENLQLILDATANTDYYANDPNWENIKTIVDNIYNKYAEKEKGLSVTQVFNNFLNTYKQNHTTKLLIIGPHSTYGNKELIKTKRLLAEGANIKVHDIPKSTTSLLKFCDWFFHNAPMDENTAFQRIYDALTSEDCFDTKIANHISRAIKALKIDIVLNFTPLRIFYDELGEEKTKFKYYTGLSSFSLQEVQNIRSLAKDSKRIFIEVQNIPDELDNENKKNNFTKLYTTLDYLDLITEKREIFDPIVNEMLKANSRTFFFGVGDIDLLIKSMFIRKKEKNKDRDKGKRMIIYGNDFELISRSFYYKKNFYVEEMSFDKFTRNLISNND